ncbi:MAG TPA: Bro-N domain-containing protein [Clostridiales bacterium]|nr:Bro-N domain-containing protein [Clostridiales bacterium]
MNGLQTFANEEFGSVRSLLIEDMPWFVGYDVAKALGYVKPRNAISVHVDDEDKNTALIQGAIQGGTQGNPNMTIINESGLYSLILSSKLPAAKRFKRWVTSEVLPAIRRTGGYGTATQAAEPETAAAETLPARETTNDDYLRAASIVASCKNERLPYVLAYLSKAGLSTVCPVQTQEEQRDRYEIMRLLVKAYNDYGISDTTIGKATGLNRAQIRMYRTGERFPKAGRAEYIKAVVEPMLTEQE